MDGILLFVPNAMVQEKRKGEMDSKEITDILKTQGLDIAEDLAVQALNGSFELIKALLPKLDTTVAMIVSPILDTIKPMLLEMIDKIDGVDDPEY